MDSPFREVTFGEEIFSEIDSNEYLNTIYESILYNYSIKLFKLGNDKLKDVNVEDALRFADILSKSTGTRNADSHKIWAQEIVALLNNIYPDNEQIKYYMGSILSNTGNYRGMDMMTPEYKEVSLLDRIYSEYNMEYLTIPVDSDMRFFPAQKQVYDNLGREFFSYSAPTSMGKSFMMRMFIKRQIMDGKQMNFAILVPTKALINEVYGKAIDDLKELLEKYDYGIATSAGDITMKLKKNHIFVMTPERMLYLLISDKTLHLDYLFIDEAHKITSRDKRSAFYYKVVDMLYRRTPRPHFIFASPNIPNPEVYLELIPEAQILPDSMLASGYSPVSQLKYYIDFVDLNAHVYNTHKREYTYLTKLKDSVKLEQIVSYVGGKTQNIVYCSSTNNAVQFARSYAKKRKKLNNEKLNALARDIRNEVHTDYYLSELIETGVAYHIGYLPADIRLRIEDYYRDGLIQTVFCTSTLIEGVNLPADNLFITNYKSGLANFREVDFKNLMGRVGRIEYNLYGNVFIIRLEESQSKEKFQELIETEVPRQKLSVVTELNSNQKDKIVAKLLEGSVEFERTTKDQTTDEYDLMRKFALILVRDILKNRKSRVFREFEDSLDDNKIQTIRQLFSDKTIKPDDDINVSVDQTENLIEAIRNGLEYPRYNSENGADYNETIVFMERLCKIFKWEIYERNTLGSVNKKGVHGQLQWYVVILLQWISGYGLGNILVKAIEDKEKNQRDVKVGFFKWEPYDGSVRHNNFIIAETLEAIEEVILFRISNYFLRFSEEYKKQHNIATRFDNDWYEFVEYGTTNKLRIVLQQSGFKRESSQYIIKHAKDYVITDEANIWLDRSILECSDNTTRYDAEKLQYNVPELFKKS